jgi:H/ACA ribonucleoprotein complex subunit 4
MNIEKKHSPVYPHLMMRAKKKKSTEELLEFGIINIDKSSGPTSFNVSEFVKKKLGLKKTSHFGTLDPKVTGVLPVALSRACKLSGYFLGEDKEYVGIMSVHEDIELKKIEKAVKEKFLGKIKQTPPLKSRVKREERERTIHEFELLEKQEKNILFRVTCEGGTYIRKLLTDLGDYMKIGAHMLELRRVRAGIFTENDKSYPAVKLHDFEKAVDEYKAGNDKKLRKIIIPAEVVEKLHSALEINDKDLKHVLVGKPLSKSDLVKVPKYKKEEIFSAFHKERFIGMYRILDEGDIFAKAEFVM